MEIECNALTASEHVNVPMTASEHVMSRSFNHVPMRLLVSMLMCQ